MSRRRRIHVALVVLAVLAALWLAVFMDWLAPQKAGEPPLGAGGKPRAEPASGALDEPSDEPR